MLPTPAISYCSAMAGSSSGAIALRNVAGKSAVFSTSFAETSPRVLSLHRDFLRSVPWIKRAYNVPLSESVRPARGAVAMACRSCCAHVAAWRVCGAGTVRA